jgi:excisionase family DNA binding protein
MSEFYSVEQVAERLGLHVRTVRGYVRAGRLKAVRIGKQYRIARADLEAFTGLPAATLEPAPVARSRHVEVSSIVEIEAIDGEQAGRITRAVMAAAGGRRDDDAPLRVEAAYDETRARLKLIILGGLATTAQLLGFVDLHLQQGGS